MRSLLLTTTLAVTMLGATIGLVATQPHTTVTQAPLPALHVQGNHLVDSAGKVVQLQGVAFSGLEYRCQLSGRYTAADYAAMRAWHVNAVKIPVNPHQWVAGCPGTSAAAYQANVRAAIDAALSARLYVLVAGYPFNHNGVSGDAMPDNRTVTTFTALLQAYGHDGRVLFEPFTEPHDVTLPQWRDGVAAKGWIGFQALFDALRQVSSSAVLFANTPDWGGKPGLVVSGGYGLRCVQCGYTAHIYDTHSNTSPAHWAANFGDLGAQVPVLAGEFGDTTHACARFWLDELLPYLQAHLAGWFAWAWDAPNSCSRPSLLGTWAGAPSLYGTPIYQRYLHDGV